MNNRRVRLFGLGSLLAFFVALAACSGTAHTGTGLLPSQEMARGTALQRLPRAVHFAPFAVVNTGNNSVTLYRPGSYAVAATISEGVNAPKTAAFDRQGSLYVANARSITVYAPGGTHVLRTIRTGIDSPAALAFDGSDNLYVANQATSTVGVYAPRGAKRLRIIHSGIVVPDCLAFDGMGNLYVSNRGSFSGSGSSVAVYAPGKTVPKYTIAQSVKLPLSVAIDSKSNVYVANVGTNTVTVYAAGGTSLKRTIARGILVPSALALDADDNLYVASLVLNRITIYAPGGSNVKKSITAGLDYPNGLAFDKSGTLYASNLRGNAVTAYAPKTQKYLRSVSDGMNQPGAVVFSPADVTLSSSPTPQPSLLPQMLFVSNSGDNEIDGYTLPLGQLPSPAIRVTNSISTPIDVFFDAQGDLFTDNPNPYPGEFLAFAPPYDGEPTVLPGVGFDYSHITAFDGNNDLFYPTCNGPPALVELPPPYTAAAVTLDPTNRLTNACSGLALDAQGDLFVNDFSGFGSGNVYEYQPPISNTSLPTLAIPPVGGEPDAELLVIDGKGYLYIANHLDVFSANRSLPYTAEIYAPPYTGTPVATISITAQSPCGAGGIRAMAVDAASDLFVGTSGCILEYAPPYTGGPAAVFDGAQNPSAMVTDPAGNLYVMNGNSGENLVLEYAPPFSNSSQPIGWASVNIENDDNKYGLALSPAPPALPSPSPSSSPSPSPSP